MTNKLVDALRRVLALFKTPPKEIAIVPFGGVYFKREVLRDADGRPFVKLWSDRYQRLDDPYVSAWVIWVKRAPDSARGES